MLLLTPSPSSATMRQKYSEALRKRYPAFSAGPRLSYTTSEGPVVFQVKSKHRVPANRANSRPKTGFFMSLLQEPYHKLSLDIPTSAEKEITETPSRPKTDRPGKRNRKTYASFSYANSLLFLRRSSSDEEETKSNRNNQVQSKMSEQKMLELFEKEGKNWKNFEDHLREIGDGPVHYGRQVKRKEKCSPVFTEVKSRMEKMQRRTRGVRTVIRMRNLMLRSPSPENTCGQSEEDCESKLESEEDKAAARLRQLKARYGWQKLREWVESNVQKRRKEKQQKWLLFRTHINTMTNFEQSRQDLYERYGYSGLRPGARPKSNPMKLSNDQLFPIVGLPSPPPSSPPAKLRQRHGLVAPYTKVTIFVTSPNGNPSLR